MKKLSHIKATTCLALCLCMFSACLPAGSSGPEAAPMSNIHNLEKLDDMENAENSASTGAKEAVLSLALPSHLAAFGQAVVALAAANGQKLNLRMVPGGVGYVAGVRAMLAGGQGPQLLWLENGDGLAELERETVADLSRGQGALGALAGMVPENQRLLDESAVYGLPLGHAAMGYVVNIELLAALLGTADHQGLLRDLALCSFDEFSRLANAMEQYLVKPGHMRIKLGQGTYQSPAFRPKQAQPVRGMFALADADAKSLMDVALPVAVAMAGEAKAQTDEEKALLGRGIMKSLLDMLDFETMHMGRREGAMRRGEDYALLEIQQSPEEAQKQFASGVALFMRADSRTAFLLQAQQLHGELALMPLKFPPPADVAKTDDNSDDKDALLNEENRGTLAALLEKGSQTLWVEGGGYICLSKKGSQSEAAQALMLRLFTTQEGAQAIKATTQLQAFGHLAPTDGIARQVANATLQDEGWCPPLSAAAARAQQEMGAYVADELMGKSLWGEAEAEKFVSFLVF